MKKITKEDLDELFKLGEELLLEYYLLTNDSSFYFKIKYKDLDIQIDINDYNRTYGVATASINIPTTGPSSKTWEIEIYSDVEKNHIGFRIAKCYQEEAIRKIAYNKELTKILTD